MPVGEGMSDCHGWQLGKRAVADTYDDDLVVQDAKCGVIHDRVGLADHLKLIAGVVEHGLFLDPADEAIIGTETGVEARVP